MKYLGYDKENNALRYTRYSTGKKIYRIPLGTDYRIFTPVARDSKKFKKKYKMRTEIERLNGRIDRDYIFHKRTKENGTNVKSNIYSNVNNSKRTYKK